MKFKTSALAMTATVAVGLMSSAFAAENSEPTPYKKLGFTTNQTYTVSVSGSTITTSAGSTLSPTPTAVNGKIEIDSDVDVPLTFTPADGDAKDATELEFMVDPSVVPNSVTLAPSPSAQCGFAIKETVTVENNVSSTKTNFWVFTDSGWMEITTATPAIPTAQFKLTVKLDYRTDFGKAQYLVDGVILGGDDAWYSIKSGFEKKVAGIDFIGNGYLSRLRGDVLSVASEAFEVEIPGVSGNVEIVVPEAVLKDIATKTGGDAKDFLAATTTGPNDKLTNLDRLVLTGATADPEAADLPKAVAKPFAAPAGQLAIKMDHLAETLPQIGGATPKFTLQGSDNKSDWTDIDSNATGAAFVFDATAKYKYYRVKAAVVYGSAK